MERKKRRGWSEWRRNEAEERGEAKKCERERGNQIACEDSKKSKTLELQKGKKNVRKGDEKNEKKGA